MSGRAVFEVIAYGPEGSFEVETGSADVAVWLWSGSRAEVFLDGTLVTPPYETRQPVPAGATMMRRILFPLSDPRSDTTPDG